MLKQIGRCFSMYLRPFISSTMVIPYLYLKGNGFPFPTVNLSLLSVLIINLCVLILFSLFLNVLGGSLVCSRDPEGRMDGLAASISAREHVL